MKSRRSDIDAHSLEIIEAVPARFRHSIFQTVETGSEEDCLKAVHAQARAEHERDSINWIDVPRALEGSEADGFRSTVYRVAAEAHFGAVAVPTADEAMPELMRRPIAAAEKAAAALPRAEGEAERIEDEVSGREEARELAGANGDPSEVVRMRRRLILTVVGEAALFVTELVVYLRVFASAAGLFERDGAWKEWAAAIFAAASCTFASVWLAHVLTRSWKKTSGDTGRVGVVTALGLLALLATGLAIVRYQSDLGEFALTDGAMSLGAMAQLLVTLVVAITAPFVLANLDSQRREIVQKIDAEIDAIRDAEGFVARLTSKRGSANRKVAELEAAIEEPDLIRRGFALNVQAALKKFRELDANLVALEGQARSMYRYLASLSPAMRNEIRARTGAPSGSKLNGAVRGAVLGVSALFLTAAINGCTAAPGAEPPHASLITACDGTGEAKAAVCTNEFLRRAFVAWASNPRLEAGRSFVVITTARDFGSTKVAARIVVPEFRGPRGERARWIRRSLETIRTIPVPRETPSAPNENKSDVVSAVLVAMREATAIPGPTAFVMASDGYTITERLNSDCRVPTSVEVLKLLDKSGIQWNMGAFASVTICGQHNEGRSARDAVARDRLWRELTSDVKGTRVYPSCAELFPPLPPMLARAN